MRPVTPHSSGGAGLPNEAAHIPRPATEGVDGGIDDGSVPGDVLVLDPSLTDAADPLTVEVWRNWARAWGLVPHDVGRLEVWWAGP